MEASTTIQRQKTEPILARACAIIRHYGKATDCLTTVLDPDYNPVETSQNQTAMFFCSVCKQYRRQHCKKQTEGEYPCSVKHRSAVQDSCRLGGSNIYQCDLGFLFWTSPFFLGERFAGAAIGSGVLGIAPQQAVEKIIQISNGEISGAEIKQQLDGFPGRNYDDVKAMAQMMLICADQLSLKNISKEMLSIEENELLAVSVLNHSDTAKDTDNEIKLLAALRRGDREEARKIMHELLERRSDSFEALQIRAIELTTFVSRAAANAEDSNVSGILEENDKFLLKIEESSNEAELSEIINMIVSLMAGKMFSFQGVLHSAALRKAERFIWKNYSRKISLKEIADAAGLSPPYFSTVFREEMGIHLSHYLNRLRVAKAAAKLVDTGQSINRIAETCGFEDQSWFSKVFKSHTGMSPGKYREQGGLGGTPGWIELFPGQSA